MFFYLASPTTLVFSLLESLYEGPYYLGLYSSLPFILVLRLTLTHTTDLYSIVPSEYCILSSNLDHYVKTKDSRLYDLLFDIANDGLFTHVVIPRLVHPEFFILLFLPVRLILISQFPVMDLSYLFVLIAEPTLLIRYFNILL